ncbi:hypothetical protein CsSME_00034277 [Camellia sinensis var. sinensis]
MAVAVAVASSATTQLLAPSSPPPSILSWEPLATSHPSDPNISTSSPPPPSRATSPPTHPNPLARPILLLQIPKTTKTSPPLLDAYYKHQHPTVSMRLKLVPTSLLLGAAGSLVRHSSSPAGFLNHLTSALTAPPPTTPPPPPPPDNGFSVTRGIGRYNSKGVSHSGNGISRLNSQLSFTRQDSLSHISEENENVANGIRTDNGHRKAAHSYATPSFGMGSWDDSNAIVFSASSSKRAKSMSSDVVHCLESQFQFGLPQTDEEMSTMENLLQIPEDSVRCKIRAKRGYATHPRSIAERDRRTRISGKLKNLQELVPNLDKQTSYADMLDLAVQHIKVLQNQVQKLHKELENCTCGCK